VSVVLRAAVSIYELHPFLLSFHSSPQITNVQFLLKIPQIKMRYKIIMSMFSIHSTFNPNIYSYKKKKPCIFFKENEVLEHLKPPNK